MVVFVEKNSYDEIFLNEMAGLRKRDTGLPVNLWLDDMCTYKKAGHWKRIKFQGDPGDKLNPQNLFSMTISEKPEIIPPNANIKLPQKEIERVRQFVKNNFDLLSKLADQDITLLQFGKMMKL